MLTKIGSRRLLTYERLPGAASNSRRSRERSERAVGKADDINNFRKKVSLDERAAVNEADIMKYFEGFRNPEDNQEGERTENA